MSTPSNIPHLALNCNTTQFDVLTAVVGRCHCGLHIEQKKATSIQFVHNTFMSSLTSLYESRTDLYIFCIHSLSVDPNVQVVQW